MSEQLTPLEDLTHEAYLAGAADQGILEHITHVGDFSYTAQTNFLGGWSEEKERRVTLLLQRTLQDGLEASGFHNLASLEAKRFRDGIEFQYLDPDYQFSYALDGRGRIQLSRPRSSSAAFHEWYRRFMPSFTHIVESTVQTIDKELTGLGPEDRGGRSSQVKPREEIIQVERAGYSFNVAVEIDHSPSEQDLPLLPNIQVLNQTLLSRVPSGTGSLSDPVTMGPEEFGRIDYSVSRWNHQKKVAEHYSVSAPSNNRWRLLLFKFGYVGETYIPSAGKRQKFNQDDFLTGETAAEAYLEFFRHKCLCGFIRDVLYGDRGRQGLSVVKPFTAGYRFVTPMVW